MSQKSRLSGIVKQILAAKRNSIPNSDIAEQLIDMGVPEKEVHDLIECVDIGFKSGVNSVITEGLSSQDYVPGENPVYDMAFMQGRAAMRFTTPFWVLVRLLIPFVIGASIIGGIIWKFFL